ncbi:oligoendopeptidase F [Bacillus taeanensis]|uniref:Oligopeptidase F n=1 Tax=Bacillus taeanensis TaxID=273032 RepID=A0A366XZ54_9BACI|nr:oligoendopeptidase F [Bacillus taeanensis]RBW69444.1 oligoendopeptidase F [Bacillus taeanensis]
MKPYTSREEVAINEKWDLTDIYKDKNDWEKDYQKILDITKELKSFNGKIDCADRLFHYLSFVEEVKYLYSKLYVFAKLQLDVDTRISSSQALVDQAAHLGQKISAATSFFMPFLLSLNEHTLKDYIKEVKGLQYFEDYLFEAYRYKQYVLSEEKEEILSQIGEALSSPKNTFDMINNADIKFGRVTADNGEKVELTRGMYVKLTESENREKRKEAYQAYYKPYIQLKNTIASTLSSAIKNNVLLTNMRGYPSALEKSLFSDCIPEAVHNNLIQSTKNNIASLHTYMKIRKEQLNLNELRAYDLNVSLVKGIKEEISFEEAYETMLKSLQPLGEEYVDTLLTFKEKRYIDVRETPGKRSGAYNLGLYGVHPFVLLNYQDDLDSLFTLAHEMGHAMHSYYSSKNQPRISAGYSIFVAEVASTVNEVLLIRYLINHTEDKKLKRYLLNHFLDKFKGTFFTQVMFSEFEKITHERAEKGEPLNAEIFNKIYESLFKQYNGKDVVCDEEVKYGWTRIPHFYRPFYVYKYATGFTSAIHIADRLLDGDKGMLTSYLTFLKSGSSDFPLELLKKTGVDLVNPEPIRHALSIFKDLVNEFSSS